MAGRVVDVVRVENGPGTSLLAVTVRTGSPAARPTDPVVIEPGTTVPSAATRDVRAITSIDPFEGVPTAYTIVTVRGGRLTWTGPRNGDLVTGRKQLELVRTGGHVGFCELAVRDVLKITRPSTRTSAGPPSQCVRSVAVPFPVLWTAVASCRR